MNLLAFVILFQICGYCENLLAGSDKSNRRSVNLALETVLEFDNNENSADIQIIDRLKGFLEKVKVVIDKNKAFRRSADLKAYKFTDFLQNAITILNSFNDEDLEDAVSVIDDEIRKYHYKGCKFHEIIEISDIRRFMAEKLAEAKKTPAKIIRSHFKSIMKQFKARKPSTAKEVIFDYINSLYSKEDEMKFRKLLQKLAMYSTKSKRTNEDLIQIVRNGIRTLIFDHYSNLDSETRRDLKIKLEAFWRNYSDPEIVHHNVWKINPSVKVQRETKTTKKPKVNKEAVKSDEEGNEEEEEVEEEVEEETEKPKKKIKKKSILKKHDTDDGQMDTTTKRQRLTFITLYPEEIEVDTARNTEKKKKHKKSTKSTRSVSTSKRKKDKHGAKKLKKKVEQPAVEHFVSEHNAVIEVERPKFTAMDLMSASVGSEEVTTKRAKKKSRYVVVRKMPGSTKQDDRRYKGGARKFIKSYPKSSHEGLSIESFELNFYKTNKARKHNDNDTFVHNLTISTNNNSTMNETVIKRIKLLENELQEVKAQMTPEKGFTMRAQYSEEMTQYERLNFWEGTTRTTPTTTTSTSTKPTTTTKAVKRVTSKTKTAIAKSLTNNGTIALANRIVNMTEEEGNAFFAALNKIKQRKKKTRYGKKRDEMTTSSIVKLSNSILENKTDKIANDHLKKEVVAKFQNVTALSRSDIEEFLNKTKPVDGDEMAKKAHIKMQEDLKKMFMLPEEEDLPVNATIKEPEPPATDRELLSNPLDMLDDAEPL